MYNNSQIKKIAQMALDSGIGELYVGVTDEYKEGEWRFISSGKTFDDSTATAWKWTKGPMMHNIRSQNCAVANGINYIKDTPCDDRNWYKYGLCEIKTNIC